MKKPNIIFILADDLGEWGLGCYGNDEIITPNIDRLAAEGVRFENFFCTSPVCSPARASILTGRIPSQHGVHDWIRSGNIDVDILDRDQKKMPRFSDERKAIEYLKDQRCYTDVLSEYNYSCGLSGKWHLGDSINSQKGFSHWFTIARGGCSYYSSDFINKGRVEIKTEYITDLIADNALEFIDTNAEQADPFYLSVHYTAPHGPWNEGEHPVEIVDLYKDIPFNSVPDRDIHPWQCNTASVGTGEKRRELLKGYYAAVTVMDQGVGRILEKLEEQGLKENTIVIFTSDNGMNMGHHGIWGKGNGTFPQNMYDTSVKVPFIISGVNNMKKGSCFTALASQYDIKPTLFDLLEMEDKSDDMELPGKSFATLLTDYEMEDRGYIVVFDEYGPVRMIRNKSHKYIHRFPEGPHEFYDLEKDPGEDNNLIGDPDSSVFIASMRKKLGDWFEAYVDPAMDGIREDVLGKGQLDLAGDYSQTDPKYAQDLSMWWQKKERTSL